MIAFYRLNRRVHGEPASEGNGEIVAEGTEFAALISKIVYKFTIFAIFARENLLELEYWAKKYENYSL